MSILLNISQITTNFEAESFPYQVSPRYSTKREHNEISQRRILL